MQRAAPVLAIAVAAQFLAVYAAHASGSQEQSSFTPASGSYAVGLRVERTLDLSRAFGDAVDELGQRSMRDRARPIEALIWYPAKPGGVSMRIRDYAMLFAPDVGSSNRLPIGVTDIMAALGENVETPLAAIPKALALAQRFPVIIYAPGSGGPAWENADLCEYLASQGFVVIASPSLGPHTREMPSTLSGAESQAQDIGFLIGLASQQDDADIEHLAVVGHSWGGLSALIAAGRDTRIKALVSLDGSFRYFPGLLKQSGVRVQDLSIPLLEFRQSELSLEQWDHSESKEKEAPSVLNSWLHGDLYDVHMLAMPHVAFNSLFLRNLDYWTYSTEFHAGDYTQEDAVLGYRWVAYFTLQFLNSYLRSDTNASALLHTTPLKNGVPRHVLTVTNRPSEGEAATFATFRKAAHEDRFSDLVSLYARYRARDTTFELSEEDLCSWTRALLDQTHYREGIAVARLSTSLYEDCGECFYALGLALELSGRRAEARQSYLRSLKSRRAAGPHAQRRLLMLSAETGPH